MKPLRGWEFDEMEGKSAATKKPNSYPSKYPFYSVFIIMKG